MTENGAKNNTNKEIFEEELESRESTCPREWLNINPDHIQWNKESFLSRLP